MRTWRLKRTKRIDLQRRTAASRGMMNVRWCSRWQRRQSRESDSDEVDERDGGGCMVVYVWRVRVLLTKVTLAFRSQEVDN